MSSELDATAAKSAKGLRLAWAFLIIGLLASVLVYWEGKRLVEQELAAQLDARATEAKHSLERQIDRYAEALRGMQTLFAAYPDLQRATFHQVASVLKLDQRLPAVQAIGFSPRVTPQDRSAFTGALRAEYVGKNLTQPLFALQPQPSARSADAFLVRYVEPLATNHLGLGFDQALEPHRLAAIEHARDDGEWAASRRVRLFVAPGDVDGVVFFAPLYRGGAIPETLAQRRAAFHGVVFLAIRIDEMLRNVFGPKLLIDLDIAIHERQEIAPAALETGEQNLIFESNPYQFVASASNVDFDSPLQRRLALEFNGASWYLDLTMRPQFMQHSQVWLPPLAALAGVLLSFLAFFFMRAQHYAHRASEAHMREARRSLHSKDQQLEFHANHDALTTLANRNLLRDRLNLALAAAERDHDPVWLVFIDLDRFKFVNDTLGHQAGDQLLQHVSKRLLLAVRHSDTVARLGGDEFVLVLSEQVNATLGSAIVQRIMDAIAHPFIISGHEFFMTCSIGIAIYPDDGTDAETLVKHADIAMYRAKEIGRNNFQFYTAELNQKALERLRLEGDLRNALERGEFVLHYQPQIDLHTGRMLGMEALIRWQHPELGLVPPARFISLAEEIGLIVPIGEWVIRTVCRQNRAWQRAGLGRLRVAVNLSARQFAERGLVRSIAAILEETGMEAQYLDIELTESLVMTDVESAIGILRELKALGVHLSIDDFGTGYSSLSYLKRFPIDVLKIDQSFVRDLATDPDDAAIVLSIISLAHSLRLQVIAEGVENEEQLAYLWRHGCDQMQGYYFSRPVTADAFEDILREDAQQVGGLLRA